MILLCPEETNLVLLPNNTVYENYTKHRRNKRSLLPKFPRRINFTTDGWRNFVTRWSDSIYRASALRSLPAGKASSFLWCLQQIWKRTDYSDPNKSSSSFFSWPFPSRFVAISSSVSLSSRKSLPQDLNVVVKPWKLHYIAQNDRASRQERQSSRRKKLLRVALKNSATNSHNLRFSCNYVALID